MRDEVSSDTGYRYGVSSSLARCRISRRHWLRSIVSSLRTVILILWMACPARLPEDKVDEEKPKPEKQLMSRANDSEATL